MSAAEFDFSALVGTELVVDVAAPYVYIGRLIETRPGAIVLEDADVHDLRDSKTTRELYVDEARRHGIRANRRRVYVMTGEILSVSPLADVLD